MGGFGFSSSPFSYAMPDHNTNTPPMAASFDPETKIYSSPRPPITFPADSNLSVTSFLFRRTFFFSRRIALIDADNDKTLTFHQLKIQVSKLSHSLLRLGIEKGDVVIIFAPNSIYFPVCFFAIAALGAVATTCNPSYTVPEILKQVADCNPKLVITVLKLWKKVKSLNLPAIFLDSSSPPGFLIDSISNAWLYSDLVAKSSESTVIPNNNVTQSDVAALLYSSGTTGKSKGVILTHRNLIVSSLMATADQDHHGDPIRVCLCFLPMFHVYGLAVLVYAQLAKGNTVVSMSKFELEMALRTVEKYRVTHFYADPPVMIALAKKSLGKKYDSSSLKQILSGAAPLRKDVIEECDKNFPSAKILQGYGMTETCGVLSKETSMDRSSYSGSTGPLSTGVEAQIICVQTLEALPPQKLGEICVRGPNIMQGYFNNEEATKQSIDDGGWLHTGDLGFFNEEGELFVVDRIKELVKCYGFQVAPAELEGILLSHPEIVDAVVIPFPDEKAGEVPVAFVVRLADSSITPEDVQKFVSKQVAPFKRLRRVSFIKSVPKSASGKILRREMIEQARAKM